MQPKILLVNPPIYDFSAFDFWLKPYGLLSAGGMLRRCAELFLFDYLDRYAQLPAASDKWGRGKFYSEVIDKPSVFSDIPRTYRRFGLPREVFQDFLRKSAPFDFAFIQTVMTYWYPGVKEAIDDIRVFSPKTKIVLGGPYAALCPGHAESLGADFVLKGINLKPLWEYLQIWGDPEQLPFWQGYKKLDVGVLRLSTGCPFNCSYCSVPSVYGKFQPGSLKRSIAEFDHLVRSGARNIAFYDDALLFDSDNVLAPFLQAVLQRKTKVNFHTPNALGARFINKDLAELMVRAGFKTFYLGFESSSAEWQKKTGGKLYADDLAGAVDNLLAAGVKGEEITAYHILGHPDTELQQLEASMRFANSLGIGVMLSDFSPIPGTADGQSCSRWADMSEPLCHNKTAFPIGLLGKAEVDRLKNLRKELNAKIKN